MMYVEFMKNFLLSDSSELIGVRVISVSFAQKRLIPTCWTWCTSSSWKIFFSPMWANWCVLESFGPLEPKDVWFPLVRHYVRRVHEKFFFHRFERTDGCYRHFGLLSSKKFDSHFLDMMYVEFIQNFFLAYSRELMGVRVISASWAQKRLILIFSGHDVRRVHEKFFLTDSSEMMGVRVISASWA